MAWKFQLLKHIGQIHVNSQPHACIHNPNKRGTKLNAQCHQPFNKPTPQNHLKLNIPKTTHYIDEVMLHTLSVRVGICDWPWVNIKWSHKERIVAQRGQQRG